MIKHQMSLDDLRAAEVLLGSSTWGPDAQDCERFTSRYGRELVEIARQVIAAKHASDCAAAPATTGVSDKGPWMENNKDQRP